MSTVAKVHQGLGFLFLTVAVIMFFLAGLGTFGEGFDAHRATGSALTVAALVLVVLAAVGRREALMPSVVLLVLMIVQTVLAMVGDDVSVIGGLHPLGGLLVLVVAHQVARGLPLPLVGGGTTAPRAV
jgi:hypothetical protein